MGKSLIYVAFWVLLWITGSGCTHLKNNESVKSPPPDTLWVSGNTSRLIDSTLSGLNSPLEVKKVRYDGEMPAYKHLKDKEIRDILYYIRQEFGSEAGTIIAADVLRQRKGLP